MTDRNTQNPAATAAKLPAIEPTESTLLPMLIVGLVMIVVGMVAIMAFV